MTSMSQALTASLFGLLISMDELRQVRVKNKNILSSIYLASSQKCKVVIKVLL